MRNDHIFFIIVSAPHVLVNIPFHACFISTVFMPTSHREGSFMGRLVHVWNRGIKTNASEAVHICITVGTCQCITCDHCHSSSQAMGGSKRWSYSCSSWRRHTPPPLQVTVVHFHSRTSLRFCVHIFVTYILVCLLQ